MAIILHIFHIEVFDLISEESTISGSSELKSHIKPVNSVQRKFSKDGRWVVIGERDYKEMVIHMHGFK